MKIFLLLFCCLGLWTSASAQVNFVNGDFETNSNSAFCNFSELNLSNVAWNGFMPNTFAFGVGQSLDIMHTTCTWGPAQSGNFFVGVDFNSISSGNAFSLRLSAPLVMGNSYTISFADKGDPCCTPPGSIELTLSTVNNAIGTSIFTGPVPTVGTWNTRTFTFIAPNNGQFITVWALSPGYWTQIDNFRFVVPLPLDQQAHLLGKTVSEANRLSWSIENQDKVKHYELEYSVDGLLFNSLKTIPKMVQGQYEVFDSTLYGKKVFYRLVTVFQDGEHHYSNTIELNSIKNTPSIHLFPNPSTGICDLVQYESEALLNLVDVQGRTVFSQTLTAGKTSLNFTTLPKGFYYVFVKNTKGSTSVEKLLLH